MKGSHAGALGASVSCCLAWEGELRRTVAADDREGRRSRGHKIPP
jgi:hypothetical protein